MTKSYILFTLCFFLFHLVIAQSKEELNMHMFEAAKNDQADSVKFWIAKGANVNYLDKSYFSALHYAIFNREYLKRCSRQNSKTDDPKLFLMAILNPDYYKGGLEVCRVLIQKGINVNSHKSGITPLMLACSKGDLRICKLLLDFGASLSILDGEGNGAISYAQGSGYKRVVNFLVDHQNYSETPTYYETLLKMDSLILTNEFNQALEIGKLASLKASEELKSYHIDIEMINKRLAVINERLRKFQDAKQIQNKVILNEFSETKERVSGMMQYPGYYNMLSMMAKFAMKDGEYLKAEIIINGIIEYSSKFGIKESENLSFLLWLSHIYLIKEDYDKSEKLLLELLNKSIENEKYRREMKQAIYLELGSLNNTIGNIKICKYYAEKALSEMGSDEIGNREIALSLIGQCYFKSNNYDKALIYIKEALVISESLKYSHYLNYAESKNDLGYCYLIKNELDKSEIIFTELKQELESKNMYNLNYCICLENLSIICLKKNDLLRAKYYAELSQKFKDKLNKQNSDLSLLASIQNRLKNFKEADSLYQLTAMGITNSLQQKFLYLSEIDRNFFSMTKIKSIEEFQSFNIDYYPMNKTIAQFSFNNELFLKGMLLNASQQVRNELFRTADSTLIYTWNKLKDIRKRINFLESQSTEFNLEMTELEVEANELEKKMTQRSQFYQQTKADQQIRWNNVRTKLINGEAAIEFSSFHYFQKEWTDSILYCALILKKGMEYPAMIPLFEQKQLDSLFSGDQTMPNNLYSFRGVNAEYSSTPNGKKLYNLTWKPLEEYLKDVKTIYYSPSGKMHQIAFAALPIDSTYYLCDKYKLVQLSSTRQLATSSWQSNTIPITSTALFGGINYDLKENEIAELKSSIPDKESGFSRGFVADSTLRSNSFNFLSGTQQEVESIATELKSKNITSKLYTGIRGNEEVFKSLSNQNISVLHIATHGFFNPIVPEKPTDFVRLKLSGEEKFRYVEDPLLRTGLILAGGNRVWKGAEPISGMDDGILTALEISEMYFPNTELVVLSACETGLGDINGGEGVFGLQRAFKLAGVKSILMSLWKVPDTETSQLMQSFYHKWLGGLDRHEAFRSAQLEMRMKFPNEPNKWAGFVMVD